MDLQRLYSLRLEDALPHHAVKLSVAVVLLTAKEVCVFMCLCERMLVYMCVLGCIMGLRNVHIF